MWSSTERAELSEMPLSAEGPPHTSPTRSGLPSASAAASIPTSRSDTTARSLAATPRAGDANPRVVAVASERGAARGRGVVREGSRRSRGWARESSMRRCGCGEGREWLRLARGWSEWSVMRSRAAMCGGRWPLALLPFCRGSGRLRLVVSQTQIRWWLPFRSYLAAVWR